MITMVWEKYFIINTFELEYGNHLLLSRASRRSVNYVSVRVLYLLGRAYEPLCQTTPVPYHACQGRPRWFPRRAAGPPRAWHYEVRDEDMEYVGLYPQAWTTYKFPELRMEVRACVRRFVCLFVCLALPCLILQEN